MESRPEHSATADGNQPPQPDCNFLQRHGPAKPLLSSAHRGWSGLSAEVRAVGKSVIPWQGSPSDTLLCIDMRGNGSLVTRRASGVEDRTVTRRGTIWLTPAGWRQGSIEIDGDLPELMRIYLHSSQFSPDKLGVDIDDVRLGALRYERAFDDPLLSEMARVIASELQTETSAGKLMVESLASSMAARLVQKYITAPAAQSLASLAGEGLDRRRLFRVLDYIEANLEGDLTLDRMASIACLSRYHFARAFKQAIGQSPHRYVSDRRLERAKALLIQDDRPVIDITFALGFSSQANFSRAFRQATGLAPGEYRRERRSRQSDIRAESKILPSAAAGAAHPFAEMDLPASQPTARNDETRQFGQSHNPR